MTDPAVVRKKLAQIETYVSELRRLAKPAELGHDVREERFIEHTLQLALQAALDVALHIVSDDRLGEPSTNRELFDLLARAGYITGEQAAPLRDMAGFRNLLVHGYDAVNLDVVREIVEYHLDDLIRFAQTIRTAVD